MKCLMTHVYDLLQSIINIELKISTPYVKYLTNYEGNIACFYKLTVRFTNKNCLKIIKNEFTNF